MGKERSAVSVMGLRVLTSVALIALLQPSAQFTLIHNSRAGGAAGPLRGGDAVSVARKKLAATDNPSKQASPHQPHTAPAPTTFHSTHTPLTTAALAHTRPANSRKTNRGENFRTSHRVGETPVKSSGKADAEGVLKRRGDDGSTTLGGFNPDQTARSTPNNNSGVSVKSSDQYPDPRDIPFVEVVQVDVASQHANAADRQHVNPDQESRTGGEGGNVHIAVLSGSEKSVVVVGEEEEGERQLLQQAVAHRTADPHVSKMVLTAIGSLTAILGVCIMAAIFQCCCRRKRSASPDDGEEEKKGLDHQRSSSSRSNSRSKSPSPHKVLAKDGDKQSEKGLSEQDALLDGDKDLGDFSMVQRETEILRSYRKPPPPKNRARASRVPRALKAVDTKASPIMLQELVDSEEKEEDTVDGAQMVNNALPSSETMSSEMQSSMLADIDSTLAELHSQQDTSPAQSADRSREPSAEKNLSAKKSGDDSQLKTPAKPSLATSASKEQLAKALVQELSRSVSKEMLSKPQSKSATPKSSENTPKSQSAGASPKPVHTNNWSASSSKDSMGSNSSGVGDASKGESCVGAENNNSGNFFALIDPTAKDKSSEPGSKSKIPVRAASSPTQPTAPLRLSAGKDKRFPVPSVHGDQMDQLMKSLKTRLKEEDGASPQQSSGTAVSEEKPSSEDLDPQSRDRSYSDPTKQQEEKGKGKMLHQTHL